MIFTTITLNESIQTRRCYLPIQIPSSMDNMYEDFYVDKHLFEFPGYEKENPFYNDENKKVISKIKDEFNGKIIEEFVGLRAKMYSLKKRKKK